MGDAHDHDEHDPAYEAERGADDELDAAPVRRRRKAPAVEDAAADVEDAAPVRRRKVSRAEAEAVAESIVPSRASVPHDAPPPAATSPAEPREERARGEGSEDAAEGASGPWGRIVETVLALDVEETYTRLADGLTLGSDATSYGAVLPALDRAERNYFDAVRLARAAKLEDEETTRAANEEMEILRSQARRELEAEKANGLRSKAPTIQDVEDRILANWPDRSARISRRRERMHGALRSIEGLVDAWRSRCSTLRVIAEKVSPNR